MSTYIISDTHFEHMNMIELCSRPENFSNIIFNNLIGHIKSNDILIHLWDISIGKDIYVHETYIKPIPWTKILVRGNHDKKSNSWYLSHGRDFVCTSIDDYLYWLNIRFSHKPSANQTSDVLNIHGHRHNKYSNKDSVPNYNWLLYSPELEDYLPVKLDRFLHKHWKI